ncbi:MAG TPA: glycosyltransferase family 4 protein [Longimicrobiales bacterium]|nr:glycosyltransferase family 4 protein [Longimicrobiales bacterium]
MRVVQASFHRDPQQRSPDQLLQAWPTLTQVARATLEAGIRVVVVQAHHQDVITQHRGVEVRFARNVNAQLRALGPQILHVHGLTHAGAADTTQQAPRVLAQDHGGGMPARWRRFGLRWDLRRVHAAAFTACEQAEPYRSLLPRNVRVFEVLENSTDFTPADRTAARAATGVQGNPCVLWVGRLNRNKDPLTALEAVRLAAAQLPDLQLYCSFGSSDLLATVIRRVEHDAVLRNRVHLLGRVAHKTVRELMSAADFFLSTSHAEGSGYALIEAIACGATPIVTDIPSYRRITRGGAIGALAPVGRAAALADALIRQAVLPAELRRAAALRHFEDHLSFAAVGRELRQAYEAILA